MAHTPGPWEVRNHPDFGRGLAVVAPQYRKDCDLNHVICELRAWQRPDPLSNAQLIAAAPELLAVCQAIANDLSLFQFTDGEYRLSEQSASVILQSLREVIAKAEGRSQ